MRYLPSTIAIGLLAVAPIAAQANRTDVGSGAMRSAIEVDLTALRSSQGTVIACLTADPERFPKCRDDGQSRRMIRPANGVQRLVFDDVTPGRYAIAVLHDENGNGKADRAMTMIPREGFGFSNDAKVRLGPPKFDDAAFRVEGRDRHLKIRMRYMF